MEALFNQLVDVSQSEAALRAKADLVLERARWANQVYMRYSQSDVTKIIEAVASVAYEQAGHYAQWAVRETGFGVIEHKKLKNELTSKALVDYYHGEDYVSPRINEKDKIVELPKPAGVVFALVPSTNPVATVNFKILMALMTRNAVVLSPHPAARECCIDAARLLAKAAEDAGAPEAIIQIVERPNIPLIEEFMKSDKTDVILATGGTAMVRAAYSSSNPALGVGPGNAPVYVDSTADLKTAAKNIIDSKSFDNSVLCTNESVLICLQESERQLTRELERANAYRCNEEERDALRRYLFHDQGFNVEAIGREATWIADKAGIRVPPKTRVLLAPIDRIGVEEPLSKEKLCPVLGFYVASSRKQAISLSRALLRMTGSGHSAAIHAGDEQVIVDYASAVEVYRVVTNAPCSQGAAGFATNLAPSFTIGTGYFGRSSVGENVGPQHLVHWTRIAYNRDPSEAFGNYRSVSLHTPGPLQQAPADGVPGQAAYVKARAAWAPERTGQNTNDAIRDEIRQIIAEELRQALKG